MNFELTDIDLWARELHDQLSQLQIDSEIGGFDYLLVGLARASMGVLLGEFNSERALAESDPQSDDAIDPEADWKFMFQILREMARRDVATRKQLERIVIDAQTVLSRRNDTGANS